MAKSTLQSKAKAKTTKAKVTTKKAASTAKTKATKATTKAKTTTAKTTTKAKQAQPETVVQKLDKLLVKYPRTVFGISTAVILGLLSYGKYYLQAELANEIFTQATSDLYVYWVAILDVVYLSGLVGLVALPAYGFYRRFNLKTLGGAFVTAFVVLALALGGLGWYVNSQPAPEPTFQQQVPTQ